MRAEAAAAINSACPRCGAAFHCGVNDKEPCACGTVKLGEATLKELRERFELCLCLSCLRQAQADAGEVPCPMPPT